MVSVCIGGVLVGSAVVARHRAQAAADLGALAAAARLPSGAHTACLAARTVASTMRATLRGCDVERLDVVVSVTVGPVGRLGGTASAVARAGPDNS